MRFFSVFLAFLGAAVFCAPGVAETAGLYAQPEWEKVDATEIEMDVFFYSSEIDGALFARMDGKSYKKTCSVPLSDLRCLHVLYKSFDGTSRAGELVCNKKIADVVLGIFRKLYSAGYQIEKIRLIDEYDADDERSMRDNNSSCFNFRYISHTTNISNHGLGLAIDINPLYNPYIKTVAGKLVVEPATAAPYTDRTKSFPHKIDRNDLCYKLFTAAGFEWGGDWENVKDYQHFEWCN